MTNRDFTEDTETKGDFGLIMHSTCFINSHLNYCLF